MANYLGIEIGGTKLQLGVGPGDGGEFVALERRDIDSSKGAEGILAQIAEAGRLLISKHPVERVGIGFGGPVIASEGLVQKSHQVRGWDAFPLARWSQEQLGVPTVIGNDCDVAALAEAHFGGRDPRGSLFYITVGTGIGGGLILGGRIHGQSRPAAAEIGHLRPGLDCGEPGQTVESLAAGPAISAQVARHVRHLTETEIPSPESHAILQVCHGDLAHLTTRQLGLLASDGNSIAQRGFAEAARVLGWAVAQVVTLVAPEVVVIGGGVSLVPEPFFLDIVRQQAAHYGFPPLAGTYRIEPAALGELVVVHGALALARTAS